MKRLYFTLFLIATGFLSAASPTEIPDAEQPQLYAASNGTVWLTYGSHGAIFVAHSKDNGATFTPGQPVSHSTSFMFGMRRGPRIAAHGNHVTVTVMGDELLAFSSTDGGRNWIGPVTINDVPTSAREGLHDFAGAPDGRLFVTWLDQRNGPMQLWGAESTDGGKTWAKNQLVYRSPDKSICECCHPSALFDDDGNLAVMWRNSVLGSRDLWMVIRSKGKTEFSPGTKLGLGTWPLDACPMDGGRIIALGGGKFASVWQRAGDVFYAPLDGSEVRIGKGRQPVAITRSGVTTIYWQDESDLVSKEVGSLNPAPVKHVANARFAAAIKSAGKGVLAYEHATGATAPIKHGPAMHSAGRAAAGATAPRVVVEQL